MNNMTFYIFKENNIWQMYIQDQCNTVLSVHKFEDDVTTEDIINLVKLITKASNLQVQVNFTNTIRED